MSHVPISAKSTSAPSCSITRAEIPFPGCFHWFIALRSRVSQSYHVPPLAAWTTWRADEETLLVVLFGLIIHGHHPEKHLELLFEQSLSWRAGRDLPTLVAWLPFHGQGLFHLLPFSPCHTPRLSWLWLCSLALSEQERGKHLEHYRNAIKTGIWPSRHWPWHVEKANLIL